MNVETTPVVRGWLEALERRHLASLRVQEVTRALRALSADYVERRDPRGNVPRVRGALDTAGRRAAFALYYAPLHFLTIAAVLRALGAGDRSPGTLVDIGCGTGVAGAAWALAAGGTTAITAIDRHPWALAETRWTWRQLGLHGRTRVGDAGRLRVPRHGASAVAAYTLNELPDAARRALEDQLVSIRDAGGRVLVVEPIARGVTPWWRTTAERITGLGGRADEWRLPLEPPPIVETLGRAAGLSTREVAVRTLFF